MLRQIERKDFGKAEKKERPKEEERKKIIAAT